MKHTIEKYTTPCGCRSVDECYHNLFSEKKALEGCVDDFARALKAKLNEKNRKGKSGWDDPDWSEEDILRQLREHIDKGDMLDVAAFAMFLWNQKL